MNNLPPIDNQISAANNDISHNPWMEREKYVQLKEEEWNRMFLNKYIDDKGYYETKLDSD